MRQIRLPHVVIEHPLVGIMRIVHWLFLVSIALFVSGIGFIIAGARAVREVPAAATAAITPTPIASVKQIMKGIVGPAATVVYNSVGTSVTAKGIEETAPKTEEEWEAVGNNAAALIESGNLMLMGTRAVDQDEWAKQALALIAGGKLALKATLDKNPDDVLAAGEAINNSCDACHLKYKRG